MFKQPTYVVSATVTPSGTGTITGTGSVTAGNSATLIAKATSGTTYVFDHWEINGSNAGTSATLQVTAHSHASEGDAIGAFQSTLDYACVSSEMPK